ncbi:MAG: AbrB/MazE/SpoVT family DNA-binding domain-containing protein [Candidatus Methanofastidiosia archaeon]|jgi:AbrB family looped-hinge helix DNA binding protein
MNANEDKNIFGTVTVDKDGQITIPKKVRETFDINPGDKLLILGDEKKGFAIVKEDIMKKFAVKILESVNSARDLIENL